MAKKKQVIYVRDSDVEEGIKKFYSAIEVIKRPFEKPLILFCRKKYIDITPDKKKKLWKLKDEKRFKREFSQYRDGMFDKVVEAVKTKRKIESIKAEREKKLKIVLIKIQARKRKAAKEQEKEILKKKQQAEIRKQKKLKKLIRDKQITGADKELQKQVEKEEILKRLREKKRAEREEKKRKE